MPEPGPNDALLREAFADAEVLTALLDHIEEGYLFELAHPFQGGQQGGGFRKGLECADQLTRPIHERRSVKAYRYPMAAPVMQEHGVLARDAVRQHLRERAGVPAQQVAAGIAVHQQIPVAMLPGDLVGQVTGDLLRAPAPIVNRPAQTAGQKGVMRLFEKAGMTA